LHSIVPVGFDKYVRILQPGWFWKEESRTELERGEVDDLENKKRSTAVPWKDVAELNGKIAHRSMQWWAIAPTSIDVRSGCSGYSAPHEGELTLEIIEPIFEILIEFGGEDQECICAIWEGYGNLDSLPKDTRIEGLGQQGYYLFNVTLGALRDQWRLVLKHAHESAGLTPQAIWPITKDWYYAIPFEMYSSYFGGPNAISEQILTLSGIESLTALPGDNLWIDEFNVNPEG